MNRGRKEAVGKIVISSVTLAIVASLVSIAGDGARAGFLFLFLLFALPIALRGRKGEVVEDERDLEIRARADASARLITLLVMTAALVIVALIYDPELLSAKPNAHGPGVPAFLMYWLATIWVPILHIIQGSISLSLYNQSEHAAQA